MTVRARTSPRDIGTKAETAVVRYLRSHGFPSAERRSLRGRLDAGDITGCPGVAWQVKGGDTARRASDRQVIDWMHEAESQRVNAAADVAVLVIQRAGVGLANAGRWWAVMPLWSLTRTRLRGNVPVRMLLADVVTMLRAIGYGDPLTDDPEEVS